jgi:hypothetical protein
MAMFWTLMPPTAIDKDYGTITLQDEVWAKTAYPGSKSIAKSESVQGFSKLPLWLCVALNL